MQALDIYYERLSPPNKSKGDSMSRNVLVCSLCALLMACTAQSPPRVEPLADLVGDSKLVDSPTRTITDAGKKSLAVIVSTSMETQIKHREELDAKYLAYVSSHEAKSYGAVKSLQESVSPRQLVATLVDGLRKRFKTVTVVPDLAAFQESGLDVAAVVDVGMEYKGESSVAKNSAEYTTEVSLFLFDNRVRKIGIANGKATEYGERSNAGDIARAIFLILPDPTPDEMIRPMIEAERKSREGAFRLLNTSLDRLVTK